MQEKVKNRWSQHEDKRKAFETVQLVPIIIIGSKFDAFANTYEAVRKKSLCLALRYLAHSNGADLVFGSTREKVPSQLYRRLMSDFVFDSTQTINPMMNHDHPLLIQAGADKYSAIGEPDGAQKRSVSFE